MKPFAVLRRALLALASVIVLLSNARPAVAAPFYFYTITAVPNWGLGNPQLPAGWSALTALAPGAPTAPENYVSLALQGYAGYWYTYDTFLGEANGFVGADISIPTAQWVTPAAYTWIDTGPAGSGGLAFFNSFNPFTGIFYANMMIVLDPLACSPADVCLSDFETDLGSTSGVLTPSSVSLDGNGAPVGITLPDDNEDPSIAPDINGINYFASGSEQIDTPEGPTAVFLLIGLFLMGTGLFYRRRQGSLTIIPQ